MGTYGMNNIVITQCLGNNEMIPKSSLLRKDDTGIFARVNCGGAVGVGGLRFNLMVWLFPGWNCLYVVWRCFTRKKSKDRGANRKLKMKRRLNSVDNIRAQ